MHKLQQQAAAHLAYHFPCLPLSLSLRFVFIFRHFGAQQRQAQEERQGQPGISPTEQVPGLRNGESSGAAAVVFCSLRPPISIDGQHSIDYGAPLPR